MERSIWLLDVVFVKGVKTFLAVGRSCPEYHEPHPLRSTTCPASLLPRPRRHFHGGVQRPLCSRFSIIWPRQVGGFRVVCVVNAIQKPSPELQGGCWSRDTHLRLMTKCVKYLDTIPPRVKAAGINLPEHLRWSSTRRSTGRRTTATLTTRLRYAPRRHSNEMRVSGFVKARSSGICVSQCVPGEDAEMVLYLLDCTRPRLTPTAAPSRCPTETLHPTLSPNGGYQHVPTSQELWSSPS